MSNRFFEPLKRIPQRIQNIGFLQKFQDKVFRPDEAIQAINSSSYGMVEQPSCFDFDPYLSLLAIGSKDGSIFIHGGKGVAFTIKSGDDHIINCIKFIPNEGRIIVTTQENLMQIFSLDSKTGKWLKTYSCLATPKQNEYITQICYHNGIIYAGFDTGYVYQFPTKDGKICIGTEEQYTISYEKALKEMSFDAKEELNLDSIIISLEVDKSGSHLLIGNQGGCIAVAKIRDEVSEKEDTKKKEGDEVEKKAPSQSANPVKIERSDSSLLRKSKTMTMNIKNSIYGENKINELIFEPFKIAIVPIPVVTHFFLFSTEVKLTSAQWFYTKEEPNQKIVASFDDGSFRVWTYKELEGDAEVEEIKTPDNQNFPYGPMPCNAMEKILHSTTNNGEDLRIFSGGLVKTIKNEPAITILKNTNQFGYGFASKIIDFMLVPEKVMKPIEENDKKTASMANEYPAYLFVLTEKEFYIIDLISENCKVLENPYLSCLDFSPITTAAYVEDVDEKIILGLVESNGLFNADETKPVTSWPIVGGLSEENERGFTKNNILFLGHEESCISLWQLENGSCMRSLGVFFVSDLFNTTQEIVNDSWPFFKKIGMSQLYDRVEPINQEIESNCHSITTLEILKCEKTLKVVVGAGNGHVSVWEINHSKKSIFEPDVNLCVVDLIERNENIVDNTSAPLPAKEGVFNSSTIASKMIHPVKMVQMKPVSPINKIVISDDWNNFAVATNYGFAVINYTTNQIMSSYFTPKTEDFKTQEMNGHSNGVPITKQQSTISMKGKNLKSIRTSFKKMKITNNNHKESKETKIEEVIEENIVPKNVENGTNGHSDKEKETPENVETKTTNGHDESQETVCEEKISKEKIEEDTRLNLIPAHISWTITSIIFTNGPLKPQEKSSPILIAGTGSGSLLIFDIKKLIMDGSDKEEAMVLCKELHLQHGAPVVNIFMLDQKTHSPITLKTVEDMKKEIEEEKLTALEPEEKKEKSKVEKKSEEEPIKEEKGGKKTKDNEDKSKTKEEEKKTVEVKKVEKQAPIDFSQDLVVVSEEQIKIFNFPSLVPKQKYKFIDRSGKMMTLNLKQAALKGVTPCKNNQSIDESKQHEQDIENMCLRKRIFSASIKQVKISENAKFSYIVVNLADGHVVVHSLPNLRRQAKIQSQNNNQSGLISASSVNGINSYTCFSAIASSKKSNSNIIATEIVRGNHQLRAIQAAVIKLPEWSRPNLATVISDAIGESVSKTLDEVNEKIMKPVEETSLQTKEKIFSHVEAEVKDISDFVEGKIETGKKLLNDVCNEMNDSIIKNGNHSIGDITMDTVKEYFQSDGVVSVKTSEVTMEKRTTIKDGDISTTVRETEKVDGEIIKDDITKLKSTSQIVDNQQEIPTN